MVETALGHASCDITVLGRYRARPGRYRPTTRTSIMVRVVQITLKSENLVASTSHRERQNAWEDLHILSPCFKKRVTGSTSHREQQNASKDLHILFPCFENACLICIICWGKVFVLEPRLGKLFFWKMVFCNLFDEPAHVSIDRHHDTAFCFPSFVCTDEFHMNLWRLCDEILAFPSCFKKSVQFYCKCLQSLTALLCIFLDLFLWHLVGTQFDSN
jgi:hypothetical protein